MKKKKKKESIQRDANSTDASAGAGKTNVTWQVDDINQDKLLAIISGHLASFTRAYIASCHKVNFHLPKNVKVKKREPYWASLTHLCREVRRFSGRPS